MSDEAMPDDDVVFDELETVNMHTLPCGCSFLYGVQETRVRVDDEGALHPEGTLVDVLEIHQYLADIGERDEPPPERRIRVVNRKQAELIVAQKAGNESWHRNVVKPGSQPEPKFCKVHRGKVKYGQAGYEQVCADEINQPKPPEPLTPEQAVAKVDALQAQIDEIRASLPTEP